ncbi:MAG: Co2+/Mg2+ efflux protein ApaG [Rhodothermales bacterium]
MVPYVATTEDITVTVRPAYLDSQSDFFEKRFVFGYFVQIENHSLVEVQLLRRFWRIEESSGRVQEVEGEGVIGKQPLISPGDTHQYSSYSVLSSFEGTMEGFYTMERPDGERFRVTIPRFHLRAHVN